MPIVKQRWACEILAAVGVALILFAAATYQQCDAVSRHDGGLPVLGADDASLWLAKEGPH